MHSANVVSVAKDHKRRTFVSFLCLLRRSPPKLLLLLLGYVFGGLVPPVSGGNSSSRSQGDLTNDALYLLDCLPLISFPSQKAINTDGETNPGLFYLFTVLQDSATDSEEIIYPIRAPSSCSAPPDLLMTTGQDQTDCAGHRQGLAAATTTNCHNSPATSGDQQYYQVHRRMRQKLMEQHHKASRGGGGAAKENLKEQSGEVTEDLVRLEVSVCWSLGGRE